MFNSPIIEVAIGLAFVYLLLSLICAGLTELIVARMRSLRSSNLKKGIENILEDAESVFTKEYYKVTEESLTKLKSVLKPEIFQELQKLKNKTYSDKDTFLAAFKDFYTSEADFELRHDDIIDACRVVEKLSDRFNNHPLIKGQTKPDTELNTLYRFLRPANLKDSNYPSFISADVFARTLLDIVQSDSSAGDVNQAIDQLPEGEIKDLLKSIKLDAEGKVEIIKANLGQWFDQTMDRVEGWYKRTAQFWTFIIAIVVVLILNVNTFTIANALWNNDDLRAVTVKAATEYVGENKPSETNQDGSDQQSQNQDNTEPECNEVNAEEAKKKLDFAKTQLLALNLPIGWKPATTLYVISYDNLCELQNVFIEDKQNKVKCGKTHISCPSIPEERPVCERDLGQGLCKGVSDKPITEDKFSELITEIINDGNEQCSSEQMQELVNSKQEKINKNFKQGWIDRDIRKIKYFGVSLYNQWPGWLFTAFAISFGAPFWFDVLNKLVNIRASGKKPEDDKNKKQVT